MKKDLLRLSDLERADFDLIFQKAKHLKQMQKDGIEHTPLKGKTLGMVFDKSSTRTRISFEVGIFQLGGVALFLSSRDMQLGRGEEIADTAKIMSRYLNGIMIRTYSQALVEEFALNATIPVINGLTDLFHPCQILSDLFTIMEYKGMFEGLKVSYIGDGNNVANSWINAASKLPFHLTLACPEHYEPDAEVLKTGKRQAIKGIDVYRDPGDAVKDADCVYTDVWVSMGQESEKEARSRIFIPYQVNSDLLRQAKNDAIVMHCLPAHRGEEISAEAMNGPQSVVWDQAENRLHVQKAIMEILM
ncbi:MAG: ornithine carbamoyltransferase [Deltaproteobacteria bacterium]|nr:ornithine carbamoyltransferase [Deltaproteobacteria bacterium]